MLRTCNRNEFIDNCDFFYQLATDITKSCYPTYCDGIKTKEDFIERSLKAFERDNEEIMIFEMDGRIEGMIHYFYYENDKYLELSSFNINRETKIALEEFIDYLKNKYQAYELLFGFPSENRDAVNCLKEQGFECIEDDYNNTAFLDNCQNLEEKDLIRIDKNNFDLFRNIHKSIEDGMYWNSDRIYDCLDEWVILLMKDKAAAYYRIHDDRWVEIYGVDIMDDKNVYGDLLTGALADAKNNGYKIVTYFAEKEYEEFVKECGFVCVGNYQCYRKVI